MDSITDKMASIDDNNCVKQDMEAKYVLQQLEIIALETQRKLMYEGKIQCQSPFVYHGSLKKETSNVK